METAQPRQRTSSTEITQALLTAATEILAEDGSGGLTIRQVAQRAGVAPMGVYSRFGSKDGLLEALFLEGVDGLIESVRAASGPDALSRLRNGCLAYREFAVGHPQHYLLMFSQMAELELSEAAMMRAKESFVELSTRVQDAMMAGSLAEGDEVEVAQLIWDGLHGSVSLELSGVTFAAEPAEAFARLVDVLLKGLAPGSG